MKRKLYCAMVTPFNDNDEIDFEVLDDLVKRIIDTHDGVVIAGSTGEGESLTSEEFERLIKYYKKYSFEKIICINEDCTHKVISKIKMLNLGDDYKYLIRVPGYYLPTDKGIIKHFSTIFNAFPNKQFIIYDIKKRTNSKLNKEIINELICYENFIGIKECQLDESLIKEFSNLISIYSGDDLYCADYIKYGCDGLISVFSIADPCFFRNMVDFDTTVESNNKMFKEDLEKLIVKELNPIGIKRWLKQKGYQSMNLRLPLVY